MGAKGDGRELQGHSDTMLVDHFHEVIAFLESNSAKCLRVLKVFIIFTVAI